MRVGFIGLGRMGEPMAANLAAGGVPLVVWNRTPARVEPLVAIGAEAAASAADVFRQCDVVVLMLTDIDAIDDVLGREGGQFGVPVRDRTVVSSGTISPADSRQLAADLADHGASYVEAPVSGSRVPAENAQLVGMLAGRPDRIDLVEPVLALTCSRIFRCGEVPAALTAKLAVNVYLIALVTGLAEAVNFADENGVDRATLRAVLDSGQMASPVSRVKLGKLADDDLSPQASIRDVHYNSRLILEQARTTGTAMPLLTECDALLDTASDLGLAGADMIAVIEALRRPGERRS
jgi:3-hydroxyisobutyrate dehydrogenase